MHPDRDLTLAAQPSVRLYANASPIPKQKEDSSYRAVIRGHFSLPLLELRVTTFNLFLYVHFVFLFD